MPKQPQIMASVDTAAGDFGGEIACGRPGERDAERSVEQHCYAMLAPNRNQRSSLEPAPGQRPCYLYHKIVLFLSVRQTRLYHPPEHLRVVARLLFMRLVQHIFALGALAPLEQSPLDARASPHGRSPVR